MDVKMIKIEEIIPYENNPRKNNTAVDAVANSIREFGWQQPIVVDKDYVIIAGHTRYKAAKKLGVDIVPCVVAEGLTDEQIKAYRLADNKVGELATWDNAKLDEELSKILEIDMSDFGFNFDDVLQDDTYTNKVQIPQYEPERETSPEIWELFDDEKCNELMEEIERSDIEENEKQFLKKAATRHIAFNYKNIAEYYAHARGDVQRLMEKSALVIIDIDNAIANGYMKLSKMAEEFKDA